VGFAKVTLNVPCVRGGISLWLMHLLLDTVIAEPTGRARFAGCISGLNVIAMSSKPLSG
jgi:hypothetical protein